MLRGRKIAIGTAAGVAALLVLAACGSSGGSGGTSSGKSSTLADCQNNPNTCNSGTVKKGGTLRFAAEKNFTGWSQLNSADNTSDFIYALQAVNPWVTLGLPNGDFQFNNDLVSSVKLTKESPQTLQIDINPKAVWSDGTAVSADDFRYTAAIQTPKQCGKCTPASTAGFDQVKSVTASNNNKTVTVEFATVYPDWQGLYQNVLPAHLAAKHEAVAIDALLANPAKLADSFNNYFVKTVPTWSNGPYKIQSWTNNGSLILVPNTSWWGTAPNLDKIVFTYVKDSSQEPTGLANKEFDMIYPQPQVDLVQQVKAIPGVDASTESGLQWEHFDLNFKNKVIGANKALRQAMFTAVNREQLIAKTVGQFATSTKVLNNHMFVPSQTGYKATNGDSPQGTGNLDKAKELLTTAGFKGVGTKLVAPDGTAVPTLRIRYTSGNAIRQQECELFKEAVAGLGVSVKIVPTDDLSTTLDSGDFDIIVFAWVDTPFPISGAYQIFTTGQSSNYGEYSNTQVDALLKQAASSTDAGKNRDSLNKADELLWQDAYNLPLYQKPVFMAVYKNFKNMRPNSGAAGFGINMREWGVT